MSKEKLLTPQQELFLSLYTNPKSETFSNALQSALKAGYAQEYAESITYQLPDWLSENLGKMTLLHKAEKVMNKTLDLEAVDEKGKTDNQLLAIQNKTAHFVAETLGKNTGYSKRTELTGKDGEKLSIQFAEVFKKDA
jgi:hypothetical protein